MIEVQRGHLDDGIVEGFERSAGGLCDEREGPRAPGVQRRSRKPHDRAIVPTSAQGRKP